jgi:glycyl-tRNA synthetase
MITNHDEISVPPGAPQAFQMVGIETSQIMHPQVWKVSGHYDLFNDPMRKCPKCGHFVRADHLWEVLAKSEWLNSLIQEFTPVSGEIDTPRLLKWAKGKGTRLAPNLALVQNPEVTLSWLATRVNGQPDAPPDMMEFTRYVATEQLHATGLQEPCPYCGAALDPAAPFKLMFQSHAGIEQTEENEVFLRPETAQGMFVNFKNVLDSSRVKIPFGIAQIGKSFRNEITPRNFTFRSREFEQMEMEFFCHPDESRKWYEYWRDRRYNWYINLGITSGNLILRDHAQEELAHYSVGTADVEYAFPFLDPGEYGELEGVAHRGDFDLRSHQHGKLKREGDELVVETDADGKPKYKGSGKDLTYFDDQTRERFAPHVIEPAAGADRATLAFLCEAYTEDQQPDDKGEMQERLVMKLHPKLAPVKAAVFPLIKKAGMPEKAADIYRELKAAGIAAAFSQQGAIGRRYRQHDEIGTPFCITVDGDTLDNGTVTIRDRDSLVQERIPIDKIVEEVRGRLQG